MFLIFRLKTDILLYTSNDPKNKFFWICLLNHNLEFPFMQSRNANLVALNLFLVNQLYDPCRHGATSQSLLEKFESQKVQKNEITRSVLIHYHPSFSTFPSESAQIHYKLKSSSKILSFWQSIKVLGLNLSFLLHFSMFCCVFNNLISN